MTKHMVLLVNLLLFYYAGAMDFNVSTPEAQGISSQAILEFVNAAEEQVDALNSFMLVRHGNVVAQGWWAPYESEHPHMLYSLSKSFTSTAIGLAVADSLLSLDDTVISFFPDEVPDSPGDNLRGMRIRDLLAMNSGHEHDTVNRIQHVEGKTWVQAYLELPIEFKPGTHFVYNSGASFMLSAILQQVTGKTVLDYLQPRLFEPLGIENATWESNAQGINFGGWGLKVKTEDIAKLGQLYLQDGMWNGERILTKKWVKTATCKQTSNGSNPNSDWEQGYGYQFWRSRHNCYRGDGAFGQYCLVMPDQDVVLAMTGGLSDMQTPLNLVWDILLPAMQNQPLPEDPQAYEQLQEKQHGLGLAPVAGEPYSETASNVSGSTFKFEENQYGIESMSIEFASDISTVVVKSRMGDRSFKCGYNTWEKAMMPFMSNTPEPVAASGAWITPETYRVKLCAYETPYIQQLDFQFNENELLFDLQYNVSFGDRDWDQLKATRE